MPTALSPGLPTITQCLRKQATLRHRQLKCETSRCDQASISSQLHVDRRLLSLGVLGVLCEVGRCAPALAKPPPMNKEVDDDSSVLIQGLLAKSKANKERYTKERLNDYYRRNFKDYFAYEKGLGQSSNGRGVSDENQQKILKWLKDNP